MSSDQIDWSRLAKRAYALGMADGRIESSAGAFSALDDLSDPRICQRMFVAMGNAIIHAKSLQNHRVYREVFIKMRFFPSKFQNQSLYFFCQGSWSFADQSWRVWLLRQEISREECAGLFCLCNIQGWACFDISFAGLSLFLYLRLICQFFNIVQEYLNGPTPERVKKFFPVREIPSTIAELNDDHVRKMFSYFKERGYDGHLLICFDATPVTGDLEFEESSRTILGAKSGRSPPFASPSDADAIKDYFLRMRSDAASGLLLFSIAALRGDVPPYPLMTVPVGSGRSASLLERDLMAIITIISRNSVRGSLVITSSDGDLAARSTFKKWTLERPFSVFANSPMHEHPAFTLPNGDPCCHFPDGMHLLKLGPGNLMNPAHCFVMFDSIVTPESILRVRSGVYCTVIFFNAFVFVLLIRSSYFFLWNRSWRWQMSLAGMHIMLKLLLEFFLRKRFNWCTALVFTFFVVLLQYLLFKLQHFLLSVSLDYDPAIKATVAYLSAFNCIACALFYSRLNVKDKIVLLFRGYGFFLSWKEWLAQEGPIRVRFLSRFLRFILILFRILLYICPIYLYYQGLTGAQNFISLQLFGDLETLAFSFVNYLGIAYKSASGLSSTLFKLLQSVHQSIFVFFRSVERATIRARSLREQSGVWIYICRSSPSRTRSFLYIFISIRGKTNCNCNWGEVGFCHVRRLQSSLFISLWTSQILVWCRRTYFGCRIERRTFVSSAFSDSRPISSSCISFARSWEFWFLGLAHPRPRPFRSQAWENRFLFFDAWIYRRGKEFKILSFCLLMFLSQTSIPFYHSVEVIPAAPVAYHSTLASTSSDVDFFEPPSSISTLGVIRKVLSTSSSGFIFPFYFYSRNLVFVWV